MAELIFYTGPMGSSKTAHALMTNFQYKEKGKNVWLIKPAIDTREDQVYQNGRAIKTLVRSRVGITAWADAIQTFDPICPPEGTTAIICDEAQFFSATQIDQLRDIATFLKVDILCFGLKTNFITHSFAGSARLFELADELVKLDNICDCGQPALVNARLDSSGKIITAGEDILIGGDDTYKAMCWKCYRQQTGK